MRQLNVDPLAGVLDAKESQMMTFSCKLVDYENEDTNNDRVSFEWTNAPENAAKVPSREHPIEFNP